MSASFSESIGALSGCGWVIGRDPWRLNRPGSPVGDFGDTFKLTKRFSVYLVKILLKIDQRTRRHSDRHSDRHSESSTILLTKINTPLCSRSSGRVSCYSAYNYRHLPQYSSRSGTSPSSRPSAPGCSTPGPHPPVDPVVLAGGSHPRPRGAAPRM